MDKQRIMDFAAAVNATMAGAMTAGMGYLGVRTGLFEAMAGAGSIGADALAAKTGLAPRYVEEWLRGMTASGWLEHDETDGGTHFRLPDEHAFLLASEGTDHFMGGLLLSAPPLIGQAPAVARAFRDGGGVSFADFDEEWIEAMDVMNAGTYRERLAGYWLVQMPDIVARLQAGGRVLDLGCGVGRIPLALAEAFPAAEIIGIDLDEGSIARARDAARAAGATGLQFVAGPVEALPREPGFDLAVLADCLHDLSDPLAVLREIRARLAPGGALFVMEPKAADDMAGNINAMGALYYGFSLFHCMTQSLASGGPGLGTCMGPKKTMELLREGGFAQVEQLAIKSQTNLFYAARA